MCILIYSLTWGRNLNSPPDSNVKSLYQRTQLQSPPISPKLGLIGFISFPPINSINLTNLNLLYVNKFLTLVVESSRTYLESRFH